MSTFLAGKAVKLTEQQEKDLLLKAKDGDIDARNQLIMRHLPLLISKANYFHRKHCCARHCESEDLIHVCVLAVIHAIKKFDPTNGCKLASYAGFWVKCYLQNARYEYSMFDIPRTTRESYARNKDRMRPSTRWAVEHFAELQRIERFDPASKQLTPLDELIMKEILHGSKGNN